MNSMWTEPFGSCHREISSSRIRWTSAGFHVRPVRPSATQNRAPSMIPHNRPFESTSPPCATEDAGRMFPVRLTRKFRTRTPTAPLPSTRGWIVTTPRGTMKAVLTDSPGFACPPPNDQETSLPLSSRKIALNPTGLKPGASASASVSHVISNMSPRFTSMRGKPLTHQSVSLA